MIIGGILAGIAIVLAGIIYLSFGFNPQLVIMAKGMLKGAIIGAVIIFGAGVIISTTRTFTDNPLRFFQ